MARSDQPPREAAANPAHPANPDSPTVALDPNWTGSTRRPPPSRGGPPIARVRGSAAAAPAADLADLVAEPDGVGEGADEEGSTTRHLRVVEPVPRRRLSVQHRRRLFASAAASLAVIAVFSLVYLHVVLAQRQFRLDQLNQQAAQVQTQYNKLRLQVADLSAPQQIISTAEGRLGMTLPPSVTYLAPSAGTTTPTVTVPARTGATQAPAGDADWPSIKPQLADNP
jgi:cell division protein FtsL